MAAGLDEAQRPHHPGQQQTLTDQRHQNDRKGQEQDQIAIGKWPAIGHGKRKGQLRRERDDAANSGERISAVPAFSRP